MQAFRAVPGDDQRRVAGRTDRAALHSLEVRGEGLQARPAALALSFRRRPWGRRAEQVAVAVDVSDLRTVGQNLFSATQGSGKASLLAAVGTVPVRDQVRLAVGAFLSGLSSAGKAAVLDLPISPGGSRSWRPDEAVHSPRSSDSVGSTIIVPATGKDIVGAWKSVVHQALGDVPR